MTDPLVSVVMTTFNGEAFVAETIQSILDQEFTDFELIVIDDASKDRTVEIVKEFTDPRIRLFPNDKNIGISASRNKGLAKARGKYIAPHDHDDISYSHRLRKEAEAMEEDPSLVLVVGRVDFPESTGAAKTEPPLPVPTSIELAWSLFVRSVIQHSFIMMRRETLDTYQLDYRDRYHCAEDFDLYHRLSEVGRITMLPDILGAIKDHGSNASTVRRQEMDTNGKAFLRDRYNDYIEDYDVSDKDIDIIWAILVNRSFCRSKIDLLRGGVVFQQMADSFVRRRTLSDKDAQRIYAKASESWWLAIAASSIVLGPSVLAYRKQFENLSHYRVPIFRYVKVAIKSLVLPFRKR